MGEIRNALPEYGRSLFGGKFSFIQRACQNISRVVGIPDFLCPELFRMWMIKDTDYDVYHFHDISSACSPMGLRWIAQRKPVVWTFHDCSPFTGGCVYPEGCKEWVTGCKRCPQLDQWPLMTRLDFSAGMQNYKLSMARRKQYVPVVPSNWLAGEAYKTGAFHQSPIVIPYGVETELFRPHDRKQTRRLLGLPEDKFTVLISAHTLGGSRKGTNYAVEALKELRGLVSVVAVGNADEDTVAQLREIDAYTTGYLKDLRLLALFYAAADAFCCPSTSDNLPMVIIETMASGTPTVGFRSGGIPELVQHGVNGWLANPGDVRELIEGLRTALNQTELLQKWSKESRLRAESVHSSKIFLQKHLSLYSEVIKANSLKPQ